MTKLPGRRPVISQLAMPFAGVYFLSGGTAWIILAPAGNCCLRIRLAGAGVPMVSSKTISRPLFCKYFPVTTPRASANGTKRKKSGTENHVIMRNLRIYINAPYLWKNFELMLHLVPSISGPHPDFLNFINTNFKSGKSCKFIVNRQNLIIV